MATKLFLRNTAASGIGVFQDMLTTAGSASDTGVVNTTASGTEIQWTQTAGGTALEWISGRVPAGGFTLAGTMTFSIWAHESNMNANCGARARVFKRTAAGSESEIGGGPFDDGVEFGTAAAEMVWTGTPTSTAFAEDDRLIVRYYITNIGTMGGSFTCTLTYNTADATTGDGFFQIFENVTFKAETITVAAGMATETGTALALGAGIGVGMASETDSALVLGASLSRAAGMASETDTAFPLGAAIGAGQAVETESALALTSVLIRPAGLAAENDNGLALPMVLANQAGIATETDTALGLSATHIRAAGLAAETDSALALTAVHLRAAGMATETDTGFALPPGGGPIILPAGMATETDTAFGLGIALSAGLATETAVALALTAVQIRAAGLASETDTGFALSSGGPIIVPVGMAVEADDAFALVYWRQFPLQGQLQASPGNDDQAHPLAGKRQRYPLEAA